MLNDLKEFEEMRIARPYTDAGVSSAWLVGFSDASENAYACCVYIVCRDESDVTSSSLLASKTRVAPLKKNSIPRLELLGALILSRLIKRVRDELVKVMSCEGVFCLTDAEIVLHWIKGEYKDYKQFVQNRVSEIRRNTTIESWYHVPGTENIADLPSRGCFTRQMNDSKLREKWVHGPQWMLEDIE